MNTGIGFAKKVSQAFMESLKFAGADEIGEFLGKYVQQVMDTNCDFAAIIQAKATSGHILIPQNTDCNITEKQGYRFNLTLKNFHTVFAHGFRAVIPYGDKKIILEIDMQPEFPTTFKRLISSDSSYLGAVRIMVTANNDPE